MTKGLGEELAQKVVDWFPKYLQHTKGMWNGKPFELLPWQKKDVIEPLFGTLKDDGTRQYKTVYVEVPKKNGKSPLAAGIGLYLLFAEREPGAEIYSAACDREQASIVFNQAAEKVERNEKLASRCKVLDSTKLIIHTGNSKGSFYRVLSSDTKAKHGFNPHAVLFDELHAQPNRNLFDVLTVGGRDPDLQIGKPHTVTVGFLRRPVRPVDKDDRQVDDHPDVEGCHSITTGVSVWT